MASKALGPILIKAVMGSTGLRLAGMGFGFLVGIQLARGLGPEGYGIYGIAISIISILLVPTELGLPRLVTREIAKSSVDNDLGKIKGILEWAIKSVSKASLIIITTTIAVLIIITAISSTHEENQLFKTVAHALILIPLISLGNIFCAKLRGLQKIVTSQIPEIVIRPALFSLLILITSLIATPLTPHLAVALSAISAAFSLFLAAFLARTEHQATNITIIQKSQSTEWLKSSIPMALTDGTRILQAHLIIFLLGFMLPSESVGLYRAANSITMLLAMPITLINIICSPIIAKLHKEEDYFRLQKLLIWASLGTTLSTLALSAPILIFGDEIIRIIFGVDFSGSSEIAKILCAGLIFTSIFGCAPTLLNMTGNERSVMRAAGFSFSILIIISPPLVYFYGTTGAAISSILSALSWGLIMRLTAQKILNLETSALNVYLFFKEHEK